MKRLLWAVGIVVLLVLVAALLLGKVRAKSAQAAAVSKAVRVQAVERGEVVERVRAPGTVAPRRQVSISARLSARIAELSYGEGDSVTRGDPSADPAVPPSVLVRLDAADQEASLGSAEARRAAQAAQAAVTEAEIAGAEAQIAGIESTLGEAGRQLERHASLLASGDVSRQGFEEAQRRFDELSAQIEAARHNLRARRLSLDVMRHNLAAADAEIARARDALSYSTILSPIDGVILRVNAEVGELVITGTMNNPGTEIMRVADLSSMLLIARVGEASVGQVEPGQRAEVVLQAYPDEPFAGVVESVALMSDQDNWDRSNRYRVELRIETQGRPIYVGLSGEAEIFTRAHSGVIVVPSAAVLARRGDDLPVAIRTDNPNVDTTRAFTPVVYRLIDGKAVATPVRIGANDLDNTVIEAGLEEGQAIIVGPYSVLEGLKHDQAVHDERDDLKDAATQPTTGAASQPASAPASAPAE